MRRRSGSISAAHNAGSDSCFPLPPSPPPLRAPSFHRSHPPLSTASTTTTAMKPSSATPFSSPLGPLHHAPPSQQGETVRALVSLFHLGRRNRTASSTSSSWSSSSKTLKKPAPSYSTLECTFDPPTGGEKSTYSPPSPCAFSPSPPPPPYSAAAALPPSGLEEDLLIVDEVAHALGLETKAERKERVRREKRAPEERERREVIEADGRMDEALRGLGL